MIQLCVGEQPFADDAGLELCFELFPGACAVFMPNLLIGTFTMRTCLVGEHKTGTIKEQFSDCGSVFSVLVVVLVSRRELEEGVSMETRCSGCGPQQKRRPLLWSTRARELRTFV